MSISTLRVFLGLLVAISVVVVPVSAGAATASAPVHAGEQGKIGIRLLEAPSDRRDDPRAHKYIIDHLEPGTTIERRVEISNRSGERRRIDAYAAAAEIEDGQFVFAEGRQESELVEWIHIDHPDPVLEPYESITAAAEIEVAENASQGEHYGVLWAESSMPPDEENNVGSTRRVGVRVYLSVGPGGEPAPDFEITEITAERDEEGQPSVSARVENTGGRALDLGGTLELKDGPGGVSAGPYPVTSGATIAPGEEGTVTVMLDAQLQDGPWTAEVRLRSGRLERDATVVLTFPEAGSTIIAELAASGNRLLWYVTLGTLLVSGVILVRLARAHERRKAELAQR